MVTSNKQSDKKVVKMTEPDDSAVVPQRTLLGEVNEQITCPLCRGYYIDATTIVECLHSFCRSCIIRHLQVKSYCPVCEMMINSAKPNIKLDKALQDIVYKLVPGLFQKEMERRQHFYASRPGPAACATPEQRGEDTERVIFSPEDVISFSLEYADVTDADSISSKSSDSNEPPAVSLTSRRFLQCPAVVNINHLKKFLSMKFDIDGTQFAIDILYKRVPLPDYYTLMDIAYIYNWKRNEPMRFFYQIIDYVAIRNRLFDINRKGTHFPDRKSSPTCTEDTNADSPAPNLNDQGSEASSGTDSPMPDDNNTKKAGDTKKSESVGQKMKDIITQDSNSLQTPRCSSPVKKNDDEVEKSQFLNSFELTAKSTSTTSKSPSSKSNANESNTSPKENTPKSLTGGTKAVDTLKRKFESSITLPEIKKLKMEIERAKIPLPPTVTGTFKVSNLNDKLQKQRLDLDKGKNADDTCKPNLPNLSNNAQTLNQMPSKDVKPQKNPTLKQQLDSPGQKRQVAAPQTILSSPKRKPSEVPSASQPAPLVQKTVSPLKIQIPKPETLTKVNKHVEIPKPVIKKMPDLKPSVPLTPTTQNKGPTVGKLRMDLLANNCDPTIDRSKIMSQVKTSLPTPSTPPSSGDPLKSLFDSCKINIPSSLSITLTDQKLDARSPSDANISDPKNNVINKNLSIASSSSSHKVPNAPVHNYIEILKLPDTDPKKSNKPEPIIDKANMSNKSENNTVPSKLPTKSSETSAKGPVPNLKPISDTKLGKQSGNFASPITFQQTFEQQLKSLKSDKKSKLPKNKTQVPKLVPATPKSITAANKLNNTNPKPNPSPAGTMESKALALDLSTPHNIQSQLGPHHTKAFETMQSIANLAKKQNIPSKAVPLPMAQVNSFASFSNMSLPTNAPPLRVPSAGSVNQIKLDKMNANGSQGNPPRQDPNPQNNQIKQANNASTSNSSPNYTLNNSSIAAQPSPRSQTRSPSSSPKLVIAEEKQASSLSTELHINQSNLITSTQLSNTSTTKVESPKASPGPSKAGIKSVKPSMPSSKVTGIRQPITPTMNTNQPMNSPADYLSQPLISHAHRALLRHQMDIQNAWLKAQRQFDIYKMSNMSHPALNDFNNKDKQ